METFSALLAIVWGIHRSPVNAPHEGQWHGALMFSLICTRINGWVNNREAGDLRLHRAYYYVTVKERFYHDVMVQRWELKCHCSRMLYPRFTRHKALVVITDGFRFHSMHLLALINALRPRQDGRHFQDDILKWIFFNENIWILNAILPKFVPKGPIDNNRALEQILAWHRSGVKPLVTISHTCVTRHQRINNQMINWVKSSGHFVAINSTHYTLFKFHPMKINLCICFCGIYSRCFHTTANFHQSLHHDIGEICWPSQSECLHLAMWQVKDPCLRPRWDDIGTWYLTIFSKSHSQDYE